MRHIDDFIDDHSTDPYASWFFALHRFPAILQSKFHDFMDKYRLFCTYEGKRWRVTGCSRLGDVWLAKNHCQLMGYDERVDVANCTN